MHKEENAGQKWKDCCSRVCWVGQPTWQSSAMSSHGLLTPAAIPIVIPPCAKMLVHVQCFHPAHREPVLQNLLAALLKLSFGFILFSIGKGSENAYNHLVNEWVQMKVLQNWKALMTKVSHLLLFHFIFSSWTEKPRHTRQQGARCWKRHHGHKWCDSCCELRLAASG